MAERLEFLKIEVKDFINQYFYRYKILENEFENFINILINYIKDMNKRENENEDSLVANCLSPFFKKLNFEPHVKYKMKGKSEIDLAILKDSDIQVIIEAKKILDLKNFALKGAFIDLNEIIKTDAEYDFKSLKPYFKIFNRDFLLQEFNPNDANQLNKGFYDELLYLLGLCEKVINGKTLIAPSKNSIDKEGTLYYNILQHLPEY